MSVSGFFEGKAVHDTLQGTFPTLEILYSTRGKARFARLPLDRDEKNFQHDFWIQRRFYLLFDIL